MQKKLSFKKWVLVSCFVVLCTALPVDAVELFAKGSVSKTYSASDSYDISITATVGMAVALISQVRIEGRYTNISQLQNRFAIEGGTVTDYSVKTSIYSLGIDVDILGSKSPIQPFIFVGAGYVQTQRAYDYTNDSSATTTHYDIPAEQGITANLGAGFRLIIAKQLAFEVEVFAFSRNFSNDNPLINLYGTAGIRIFI